MSAALSLVEQRRVTLASKPVGIEVMCEELMESQVVALLDRAHAHALEALRAGLAARDEWRRDQQEAETRRQSLVDQRNDIAQQREIIADAADEGMCPLCAHQLGGKFRAVLEVLDTQAEAIHVDEKYFIARIRQLDDEPEEVLAIEAGLREAFDLVLRGLVEDDPSLEAARREYWATDVEPAPPSDVDYPGDGDADE